MEDKEVNVSYNNQIDLSCLHTEFDRQIIHVATEFCLDSGKVLPQNLCNAAETILYYFDATEPKTIIGTAGAEKLMSLFRTIVNSFRETMLGSRDNPDELAAYQTRSAELENSLKISKQFEKQLKNQVSRMNTAWISESAKHRDACNVYKARISDLEVKLKTAESFRDNLNFKSTLVIMREEIKEVRAAVDDIPRIFKETADQTSQVNTRTQDAVQQLMSPCRFKEVVVEDQDIPSLLCEDELLDKETEKRLQPTVDEDVNNCKLVMRLRKYRKKSKKLDL